MIKYLNYSGDVSVDYVFIRVKIRRRLSDFLGIDIVFVVFIFNKNVYLRFLLCDLKCMLVIVYIFGFIV